MCFHAWFLFACLACRLICVVYPIYVIRPFRPQGARELAVALVVSRFRPASHGHRGDCGGSGGDRVLARAGARSGGGCWRRWARRWWCVLAVLARVNVYELMFHPVDHPSFAAASEVKLDGDEKVIAVKIGGEARAYPIRSMSYHHIVNDVVGADGASSRRIERSVTPVWCGRERSTGCG